MRARALKLQGLWGIYKLDRVFNSLMVYRLHRSYTVGVRASGFRGEGKGVGLWGFWE